MASKRKLTSRHYAFESFNSIGKGYKFTKICDDMMNSKAWKQLSMRQRGLYLELKKGFVTKNGGETHNQDELYIYYKNYKREYGSKNTLFNDVDALIENGFIRVIHNGKTARLPNIYGFWDMWKKYGNDDFFIHPSHKRWTKENSYNSDDN